MKLHHRATLLFPPFVLPLSALVIALSACVSTPPSPSGTPNAPQVDLVSALGMQRDADDLGFAEQAFDPCQYGLAQEGACRQRYFTVVHFQLLCRDSEGTVSTAPLQLQPIVYDHVVWNLAGQSGGTRTDGEGYGQFSMISSRSTRGKRLILHIGPQFVGFTASDVSKIVLPKNYCRNG
jgi:hypothetical protein